MSCILGPWLEIIIIIKTLRFNVIFPASGEDEKLHAYLWLCLLYRTVHYSHTFFFLGVIVVTTSSLLPPVVVTTCGASTRITCSGHVKL